MTKVRPFLMFNDQLEAAMEFYTATFPGSQIRNIACTGTDGPVASAEFVVGGQVFMGYNGGPYFAFSEDFSLYVDCEDQAEVDEYMKGGLLQRDGLEIIRCGGVSSFSQHTKATSEIKRASAWPCSVLYVTCAWNPAERSAKALVDRS